MRKFLVVLAIVGVLFVGVVPAKVAKAVDYNWVILRLFLDIDNDGVKDANEGYPYGLHVTGKVDYGCNGGPEDIGILSTDANGYVTLAITQSPTSICLTGVKMILPKYCWSGNGPIHLTESYTVVGSAQHIWPVRGAASDALC